MESSSISNSFNGFSLCIEEREMGNRTGSCVKTPANKSHTEPAKILVQAILSRKKLGVLYREHTVDFHLGISKALEKQKGASLQQAVKSTITKKGLSEEMKEYHETATKRILRELSEAATSWKLTPTVEKALAWICLLMLGGKHFEFFMTHPEVTMDRPLLCQLVHLMLQLQHGLLSSAKWIQAESRRRLATIYQDQLQTQFPTADGETSTLPSGDKIRSLIRSLKDSLIKCKGDECPGDLPALLRRIQVSLLSLRVDAQAEKVR